MVTRTVRRGGFLALRHVMAFVPLDDILNVARNQRREKVRLELLRIITREEAAHRSPHWMVAREQRRNLPSFIRATTGHSLDRVLAHTLYRDPMREPIGALCHGTRAVLAESSLRNGLIPGGAVAQSRLRQRNEVFFSEFAANDPRPISGIKPGAGLRQGQHARCGTLMHCDPRPCPP